MNNHELWQSVLGELELTLSRANFTTWFKQTFIASFRDGEMVIGVPNAFTQSWLEKKYNKEILQSIQNITNTRVRTITYRIDTHIPNVQIEISLGSSTPAQSIPPSQPHPQPPVTHPPEPAQTPSIPIQSTPIPTPSTTSNQRFGEFAINPKYSFQSFIVGKQNELANAAAQAVSNQPGTVYNPLFIYGGVGLGKTHLLQAIGNEVLRKNPKTRVLYVTCERFTNDFINAVRSGLGKDFKNHYRTVDLFIVDDIQFITGKEGTQEEFFHTFNQLHQNNKQIIISSDRPPKAIPSLEDRLISRFESGMMTDVGIPDFETRTAILELKCREKQFAIDRTLLLLLANSIQSNVRELEGALNKIIAIHQFKNMAPTEESVRPIIASFQTSPGKKTITPRQLIHTVATYYDLPIEDILGQSREKRFAFPRQVVMFLMREEMKSSYPTIGAELGGRDHTTAMHAYEKISQHVQTDEKLQHDLELIKQRLYTA